MKALPVVAYFTLIAWSPSVFAETDTAIIEIESDAFQAIFLDIGTVETLPDRQTVWFEYRYFDEQLWLDKSYDIMKLKLAFDCEAEVFSPVLIQMTTDEARIVKEFERGYSKGEWRAFEIEPFVDKGLSMICEPVVN